MKTKDYTELKIKLEDLVKRMYEKHTLAIIENNVVINTNEESNIVINNILIYFSTVVFTKEFCTFTHKTSDGYKHSCVIKYEHMKIIEGEYVI